MVWEGANLVLGSFHIRRDRILHQRRHPSIILSCYPQKPVPGEKKLMNHFLHYFYFRRFLTSFVNLTAITLFFKKILLQLFVLGLAEIEFIFPQQPSRHCALLWYLQRCWWHSSVLAAVEQLCTASVLFLCHSTLPPAAWGWAKSWQRTADPNWPKGYSIPCDVSSDIKAI